MKLNCFLLSVIHRPPHDASFGGFDEVEYQVALYAGLVLCFDGVDGVCIVEAARVERAVDVLDEEYLVVGEASAVQPYDVDAAVGDRFATDEGIGRDVFADARAALYHDVLRDAGELVYERAAADDGVVVYLHFAGYLRGVADDDVVVYYAVVRHVRVCHYQAVVAYYCSAFRGCAAIDGGALADGGIVAYLGGGGFAGELKVLRYACYDRAGEDVATLADTGAAQDGRVGIDMAVVANDGIPVDDHKRLNVNVLTNLCFRVNNG